ncbi:MAG: histone deacetylase family protein [Thermoanaerobaculia bacterium]
MTLAIYTHPDFQRHDTGDGHPETAWRLDAALEGVARASLEGQVVKDLATPAEADRLIAKVHAADYARELETASAEGWGYFHSTDNPISAGSYAAARSAVAATLGAASALWREKTRERAFVVARPPGHHAEKTLAMGFCFFNTIAIAAEFLRELPGIERVFILDWDVHHGNGTQHLFESREDIFYASLHRYPFYPGTGAASERGVGAGLGTTLNVPFHGGVGDVTYLAAIEKTIIPAIDDFRPQAILVSAGFDAHARDPLGGMRVTAEAFGTMTRRVVEAASRHTEGRVLSLLEGGYDREGLASSVAEHVAAMV